MTPTLNKKDTEQMKMLLGTQLHHADRAEVLRCYVHRYTGEHKPLWAHKAFKGGKYPLQFANDADWLAHTRFAVKTNGRLDQLARHCESSPTWPNNPELRRVAA